VTGTPCPRCRADCASGSGFCASCGTKLRKTCTQCAADWPAEYAFCAACGTKLGVACPKCEAEWPAEYAFCGKCGTQLPGGAAPVTRPPAARPAAAKPAAAPAAPTPAPAPRAKAPAAAPKKPVAAPKPPARKSAAAAKPAAKAPVAPKPAEAPPPAKEKAPAAEEPPAQPAIVIKPAPKTAEEKAAAGIASDDEALTPAKDAERAGRIDDARKEYEQVIETARKDEAPASKALLAAALDGMARVYRHTSEYDRLRECGETLAAVAVGPAQQALGERWIAVACWREGHAKEAEAHFEAAAKAAEAAGPAGRDVLADALCDHASLLRQTGRMADAKKQIRAARRVLRGRRGASAAGVQADLVEGGIARREGRLVDALQLFSSADTGAKELNDGAARANASIALGNVRKAMGDYEHAAHAYTRARDLSTEYGLTRLAYEASIGLGNTLWAQGDLDAARVHNEEARTAAKAAGDVSNVALATANLAKLNLELGDPGRAVGLADEAIEALARGLNEELRGLVMGVKADALLAQEDAAGAKAVYEAVVASFEEESHPNPVCRAWRGLGRIALLEGDASDACALLARAVEGLTRANSQEHAAATRIWLARAHLAAGNPEPARHELAHAREVYEQLGGADRQLAEIEALEAQGAPT